MTPQNSDLAKQIQDMAMALEESNRQISELKEQMQFHSHDGNMSARMNFDDLLGGIELVSAAPSGTPTEDIFTQLKIYRSGSTYRLYWFDGTGWRYAAGT